MDMSKFIMPHGLELLMDVIVEMLIINITIKMLEMVFLVVDVIVMKQGQVVTISIVNQVSH